MSPTIRQQTQNLLRILTLGMILLLVSAAGGLSLVWMRQEISRSAASIMAKENELAGIERTIRNIDSRIAAHHSPEALKAFAARMNLGLISPKQAQIVHLFPRRSESPALPDPFRVNQELALLDTQPNHPE